MAEVVISEAADPVSLGILEQLMFAEPAIRCRCFTRSLAAAGRSAVDRLKAASARNRGRGGTGSRQQFERSLTHACRHDFQPIARGFGFSLSTRRLTQLDHLSASSFRLDLKLRWSQAAINCPYDEGPYQCLAANSSQIGLVPAAVIEGTDRKALATASVIIRIMCVSRQRPSTEYLFAHDIIDMSQIDASTLTALPREKALSE